MGPKRQLLKGNQAQHVLPATIPELLLPYTTLEYSFAVHRSSDARASFLTTYINDVGVSVLFSPLPNPFILSCPCTEEANHFYDSIGVWYIAGQVEPATGLVANGKDVSAIVALQV